MIGIYVIGTLAIFALVCLAKGESRHDIQRIHVIASIFNFDSESVINVRFYALEGSPSW